MLNSLGIVRKITGIYEWTTKKKYFIRDIRNIFFNKTVVVVGSSPELIGAKLGKFIDSHDFVVRINGTRRISDPEDFGLRTDCLIFGGTFLSEKQIRDRIPDVNTDFFVISTQKNKSLIDRSFEFKNVFYYPILLPKKISEEVERSFGCQIWGRPFRPPRSGFVMILTIHKYAQPKKISVIGMSSDGKAARQTIGENGEVRTYDERILLGKHCDPRIEIQALQMFVDQHENITWISGRPA
jgi:hypothetical protein